MVVGLMPFLQTCRTSAKQERVRGLAQRPRSVAALAGATAWLPGPLKRAAIRAYDATMDAESVDATAMLLRRDVARAAFEMAKTEFEDLDAEHGWDDLAALAASGRCAAMQADDLVMYGVWLYGMQCRAPLVRDGEDGFRARHQKFEPKCPAHLAMFRRSVLVAVKCSRRCPLLLAAQGVFGASGRLLRRRRPAHRLRRLGTDQTLLSLRCLITAGAALVYTV
jgi:hypothetical protein